MPSSMHLSVASAQSPPTDSAFPCAARIDWRPSPWLGRGLALLGLLAAASLLPSDLPGSGAWPCGARASARGFWLWWRQRRMPAQTFVFRKGATPLVDGAPARGFVLHWRGPLAFASWRDTSGRLCRRAWWPDTLPPAPRRELRLAVAAVRDAGGGASMAP